MPIAVRPLGPGDAIACGAIVEATPLWSRIGLTAAGMGDMLTRAVGEGDSILVADDASVVGFAWVDRRGAFGRSGYLRMIAVHPERRSAGVGAQLLAAFEAIAAQEGRDAFLLVSDFNAEAQRFYARHGYGEVGRLPGYVSPGVSELLLWKRLR